MVYVTIFFTCLDQIYFKILVPSIAAGAIIGKGGEAIAQIQKETSAKIKLSKNDDFYPGTSERVCLIQGSLEGVTAMHNYVMDRIMERPETTSASAKQLGVDTPHATVIDSKAVVGWQGKDPQNPSRLVWERHKQVMQVHF
ncbi:unnamed protein product [Protopolystoma xenopodis]|uniref:K Homology domain-containing protein n=1 Tax=Protopolystoma xenopodis TaxID=117903 RepID=A0A448X647_9PLAT|nr:unnamed protein product [Protopolystoma xenopodis]